MSRKDQLLRILAALDKHFAANDITTRVLRLIILLPLTIVSRPSGGVAAEMSLTCAYSIMTSAHHFMTLCGEPLDHPSEVKYHELRAALQKYINENAQRDVQKIGPDYDERFAIERKQRVQEGFCNRLEYIAAKTILFQILHTEPAAASIRKHLDTPGDPSQGDCF